MEIKIIGKFENIPKFIQKTHRFKKLSPETKEILNIMGPRASTCSFEEMIEACIFAGITKMSASEKKKLIDNHNKNLG